MRENNTVQNSTALQWKLMQSPQLKVPPLLKLFHFLKHSFLCSCTAAGPPGSLARLYMKYIYLMKNSDFPKYELYDINEGCKATLKLFNLST